jgi:PAS domain S-box-containing protein
MTTLLSHTILIVDDSAEDREAYRRYLSRGSEVSYQFIEAETGQETFSFCEQFAPDAILLDYQLPDLDGLTVLEQLNNNANPPPIIMLTGQGDETLAVQALKKGAEHYLVKGKITAEQLRWVVEGAIEHTTLRRQLQKSEKRLRIAVENMFDCFGIYTAVRDQAGHILDFKVDYLNEAACQYHEATKCERQIGRNLCELFPENRENGLFKAYCQVVETGIPLIKQLLSHTDIHQSHLKRATELRVSKVDDGFLASWRDITLQKQLDINQHILLQREQAARHLAEQNELQQRLIASQSQENQRFIEQVANTTPGILYVFDLLLQQNVYVNQQVTTILGYTPEQIQAMGGTIFSQLFYPDDLDKIPAHVAQFEQSELGDVFSLEYRMRHINGEWRWFHGREIVFRRTETGKPWQILGIAQDITDLKQIQERYELAAAAVNCIIYDWDIPTQQVRRSQGIYPLIGYTAEEAGTTLQWWSDRIHPDDIFRVTQHSQAGLETGDRYAVDYRVQHREGHYLWVLDNAIILRDNQGAVIRVVGSTREISAQKESEVNLEAALQKLNFQVENSPLAVIEWDEQYRICRWSTAAEKMFGWQAEEVLGKTPFDWKFIFVDDIAVIKDTMENFRSGRNQQNVLANRNYRKDGTVVYCEWYNSGLTNESGQLISVLSLVQNISDRVQLQIDRDRILQLEQEARTEAEAANQAKDDFIAVVSHELRSPLNSILGWTKLISMGKVDSETLPQALQAIERGAQSQVQIVDDLLDISRIIRGKLNLVITPFNLKSIVQTVISLYRPTAEAKQIHIIEDLETSVPLIVSGDSQRVQQMIGNLLTNAIKFTPPEGLITVKLAPFSSPLQQADKQEILLTSITEALPALSYAKITVQDSGKGISAELLPHIFDRFRQAQSISGKSKDGLGLGLAIVKQLTTLHQGSVWAECKGEGQGATFNILLPLIQEQGEEKPSISSPLADLSQQNVCILVVDDNPDTLNFLKFVLENQGMTVMIAGSAQQGFEIFCTNKPDVLISDIGMAEEDGYRFLRRLRLLDSEQHNPTPAIALTAFTQAEAREKAAEAGYQHYLTKPVDIPALLETIASLVKID